MRKAARALPFRCLHFGVFWGADTKAGRASDEPLDFTGLPNAAHSPQDGKTFVMMMITVVFIMAIAAPLQVTREAR